MMPTSSESGSEQQFWSEVNEQIAAFESCGFLRLLATGGLQMHHYHALLSTLFHQTRSGPYTFAMASANCSWRHEAAKEYLLEHALEERSHWRWMLADLQNTGYAGPDPRLVHPHVSCDAFISFNRRIASEMPVARLAIAAVLEGIGGTFGSTCGRKLVHSLSLRPDQATFFIRHGETDKTHINDLRAVVAQCRLDAREWSWMTHAAHVAGVLYAGMYSHEAYR